MGLLSSIFPPSLRPAEGAEQLHDSDLIVVDVRERHEFTSGSVGKAMNIPLPEISNRLPELDTSRRYLVVCRSGARSRRAATILRRSGVDVVNLKGGVMAWQRAGLPLATKTGGRRARTQ